MTPLAGADDHDSLTGWLQASAPARQRGQQIQPAVGRLRFAFYGRISTAEYQDPVSSRQWQYDNASRLIAGHGRIVGEYFDVGYSRSLAWTHRPQAAVLLALIWSPHLLRVPAMRASWSERPRSAVSLATARRQQCRLTSAVPRPP